MTTTTRASLLLLICSGAVAGCGSSLSQEERDEIAVAYAETLIAREVHQGDSAASSRAVDSALRAHGIEGIAELERRMNTVALQSDAFRAMLDTVQQYLERVRAPVSDSMRQKKTFHE